MSEVVIRKVEKDDNVKLAHIIRSTFIEYYAPKEGTVYSDPTTDNLYELFQEPKSCLFVAEEKGKVIGCCGIFPTKGLPANCIEVVKFYITNKARGKGYGKALFLACEQVAIAHGYSKLYLESIPEYKKALGLYEKLGFTSLLQPLGQSGHFGCNIWLLKAL